MIDLRCLSVIGPDDGHDVKAASLLEQVIFALEMQRCQRNAPLLLAIHRFRGCAVPPGLDFDENQNVTLARDQVDLALGRSIAAKQDSQSVSFQVPGGGPFAAIAEQSTQQFPEVRWHRWVRFCRASFTASVDPEVAFDFSGF
jgi:hypothetical protein